jgi:hypothetical protein
VGNEDGVQALHDAILEALIRRGLLSDDELQRLMDDADAMEQFLDKTVERLVREGYLRASENQPFHDPTAAGSFGPGGPPIRFELTEKGTDFLGYKPSEPPRLPRQVLVRAATTRAIWPRRRASGRPSRTSSATR